MDNMDEYFAPRQRLTGRQHVIRGVAIYTACYVAVVSFEVLRGLGLMEIVRRHHIPNRDYFFINLFLMALGQSIFIVPIWRCYCLRRWGAVVTFIYCVVFTCFKLWFLMDYWFFIPLPIIITLTPWFFMIFVDEWPNLKSGF